MVLILLSICLDRVLSLIGHDLDLGLGLDLECGFDLGLDVGHSLVLGLELSVLDYKFGC